MIIVRKLYQLAEELFLDRRLLFALAKKDFQRKFAGSYLGTLWAFVQPALTTLVYCIVFQFAFYSSDVEGFPFVVWFLPGIVLWLFVSEAISASSNCYLEYSYLVKKVVFSIDILPMVKILSSFFIHLCFLVLVEIILLAFGILPTMMLLQLPYYMLCTVLFVYGISMIFSSVMVFFRDLGQIISLILLVGMWGTPIAWRIDIFAEEVQGYLMLNPVFYLVEGYRDCFMGREWFFAKPELSILFWAVTLFLLTVGAGIYGRLKVHFADVL